MGCTSNKRVLTTSINPAIQKVKIGEKNIEVNKEPEKITKQKEENHIKEEMLLLKYETETENETIRLFGNDVDEFDDFTIPFFEREKDKFELYENDIKINDCIYAFERPGIHTIKMIIKAKITDFSYMFYDCEKLKGITGYIDTSKAKRFSWMFNNYTSLIDISILKDFDIRNSSMLDFLFDGCAYLSDISPLKDWDLSGDKFISSIFCGCASLKDITPLKNSDVSNIKCFTYIFSKCTSLNDIKALRNWNVTKEILLFISLINSLL